LFRATPYRNTSRIAPGASVASGSNLGSELPVCYKHSIRTLGSPNNDVETSPQLPLDPRSNSDDYRHSSRAMAIRTVVLRSFVLG
jgi:hypothetical protein